MATTKNKPPLQVEMFYNSRRRHSYLGSVSPKEFEEMQILKQAAFKKKCPFLCVTAMLGKKGMANVVKMTGKCSCCLYGR